MGQVKRAFEIAVWLVLTALLAGAIAVILGGCSTAPPRRPVQAPPMPKAIMAPEFIGPIVPYVTVDWQPSPTSNVTYRLYTNGVLAVEVSGTNAIVDRLAPGHTYNFYATATNSTGESVPSNSTNYTVPLPQVVVTVSFSANVATNYAVIWQTNYTASGSNGFWRMTVKEP